MTDKPLKKYCKHCGAWLMDVYGDTDVWVKCRNSKCTKKDNHIKVKFFTYDAIAPKTKDDKKTK